MFLCWLAMIILHPGEYLKGRKRYREWEAWFLRFQETVREEREFPLPLPVDGNAVTCGNRADLPKKQRRHEWADLGTDIKNGGEKGIIETQVRACTRCGKDDR